MGEMKQASARLSNFELLRLISIFMIVLIHANMYIWTVAAGNAAGIYTALANGLCNTGVSMFILISGYFGVKLDVKKLTKLELRMITYSLIVFVVSIVFFGAEMGMGDKVELLSKSLLPFISRNHWFYSCYVLILLFSGYINDFVEWLGKKRLFGLILMMLVVFSVFPTFFYYEVVPDNGKGIVQMFMVYLMGRYLRMIPASDEGNEKLWGRFLSGKLSTPVMLTIAAVLWAVNTATFRHPLRIGGIYHTLCKDNSITNIVLAVTIFLLFSRMKFSSGLINYVAKFVFAIFAMNYVFIDVVMKIFFEKKGFEPVSGIAGVALYLGICIAITLVCVLIGIFRELILAPVDEKIAGLISRFFVPSKER